RSRCRPSGMRPVASSAPPRSAAISASDGAWKTSALSCWNGEQEALRQSEALNKAKDELLATVSHELRTPLNSIFGWARMLQSADLDDAGRTRAINAILRNASAQTRLVEDLVDLSRIAAGRLRLDFEWTDLNAIVEAALEIVRPAASAKAITL